MFGQQQWLLTAKLQSALHLRSLSSTMRNRAAAPQPSSCSTQQLKESRLPAHTCRNFLTLSAFVSSTTTGSTLSPSQCFNSLPQFCRHMSQPETVACRVSHAGPCQHATVRVVRAIHVSMCLSSWPTHPHITKHTCTRDVGHRMRGFLQVGYDDEHSTSRPMDFSHTRGWWGQAVISEPD